QLRLLESGRDRHQVTSSMPSWAISMASTASVLCATLKFGPVHLIGNALVNDQVRSRSPPSSSIESWMPVRSAPTWDFWNHFCRSDFVVIPRLSTRLGYFTRVGRWWLKLLFPPSGYVMNSTSAERPEISVN